MTFFFESGGFDTGFHDVAEGVEGHGEHGGWLTAGTGCGDRTRGVEYGMVEIGIGIGLTACPEESFSFTGTHVGDVFGEMGNALLLLEFVCGSGEDLEMGFEASRGGFVG